LLPKSRPGDLREGFTRFLDKALALKKEMTQEQAVYRCFMIQCGHQVSDVEVDLGDDNGGTLLVCTFPGLTRHIVNEDMKFERPIVVRADGELNPPIPTGSSKNDTSKGEGQK
jgi:hypothetical protein